jgi:ferredoxin/pyruvate/2-oxoacid:ferredoxin oxidoreductase alpha subunit
MPERPPVAADRTPLRSALRQQLERLLAGSAADAPTTPGQRVASRGLEALLAVDRLAGAVAYGDRSLVADPALAADSELVGVSSETLVEAGRDVLLPGGLAAAAARALGGDRCSVYLAADEVITAEGTLARAVDQRVPLLVVVSGASAEVVRSARGSGAVVFAPASLGAAVDFALAARLLAERALVPVVLLLDRRALVTAIQETFLPTAETCRRLLGHPADSVHTASTGDRELFGAHRRRVPRLLDPSLAVRLGAEPGPLAAAPRLLAGDTLFAAELPALVAGALAEVAGLVGRPLAALSLPGERRHGNLAVLAAGATGEIAASAVASLGTGAAGSDARVVVLQQLSPWPAEALAAALDGTSRLLVVEVLANAASSPAWLSEAVATHAEAGGEASGAVVLAVAAEAAPLRLADLAAAVRRLAGGGEEATRGSWWSTLLGGSTATATTPGPTAGHRNVVRWVLGADLAAEQPLPKVAARRDQLLRNAPRLATAGVRGESAYGRDPRPAGSVTIALERRPTTRSLLRELAELLLATGGGHLRTRAEAQAPWAGGLVRETLSWSPEPLSDLGDQPPADLVLGATGEKSSAPDGDGESAHPNPNAAARTLGTVFAWLVERGLVAVTPRRLRGAREAQLAALPAAERGRLLDALEAAFTQAATATRLETPARRGGVPLAPPRPFAAALAAHPGTSGDGAGFARATAFWDEVAQPLHLRPDAALLPTPTLAVLAEPALASPFGGASALAADAATDAALPGFAPALCTGCGACWAHCPHGAIEARWLPTESVLEHALTGAARSGRSAEAIRRFVPKLALRLAAALHATPAGEAGRELAADALLRAAGEEVLGASADERNRDALGALAAALGPLAITLPREGGTPTHRAGELLALAIDPDRCTRCGLCVEVCTPTALAPHHPVPPPELLAERCNATVALPATPEEVRARLTGTTVGPIAAALLAGAPHAATAGADSAPAGSLVRLAVRQTVALASRELAASRRVLGTRLEDLSTRLAQEIHTVLGRALPDQDLAALAGGLGELAVPTAGLGALVERLGDAVAREQVDIARLRRLVDAARAVADLGASLGAGEANTAGSRSDLLLVVGGGPALAWARQFPDNPFAVPTLVAPTAPLAAAQGLAAAQVERAIAGARVLRRAGLELERPAEARLADERLADLGWTDLDATERTLAAAVLVLLDERYEPADATALFAVLGGELPIAVLSLAAPESARLHAWTAVAFAASSGLVAHATPLHPRELAAAVHAFVERRGEATPSSGDAARPGHGALLRLLAPTELAAPAALALVRGAVEARRFPLGCHHMAATDGSTAPPSSTAAPASTEGWVDPFAAVAAERQAHADALAGLAARHREELAVLERELRHRLAGEARERLLALLAARRATESPTATHTTPPTDPAADPTARDADSLPAATPSGASRSGWTLGGGFGTVATGGPAAARTTELPAAPTAGAGDDQPFPTELVCGPAGGCGGGCGELP